MDDGIGGVRGWLTAGKHTLQQRDGYTKEAARGDDAARRFPFSPFSLKVWGSNAARAHLS